jgi:hypothetical protein
MDFIVMAKMKWKAWEARLGGRGRSEADKIKGTLKMVGIFSELTSL